MTTPTGTRQGVQQLLGLSTAHLPQHLGTDQGSLAAEPGIIAAPLTWGWLIIVPAVDTGYDDRPGRHPAVVAIVEYARALGCDYVLFDADTEPADDLPVHPWL